MSKQLQTDTFSYFESLSVENVKGFAGAQTLQLTGSDGFPSP